jgi:hypothetical protein
VVSAGRQPGDGWIAVGTRRLTALGSHAFQSAR